MKYVVDIDGTICTQTNGNYEDAVPYEARIAQINRLYDEGHHITYLTARGMGRTNSVDLATSMFYNLTRAQLDAWQCKYHELILGKPSGDYYIDDKAVHTDIFFKRGNM